MNDYVIYTDSGCDMSEAVLSEWNVPFSSLTFRFTDSEREYLNGDMPINDFYKKMTEGKTAKTSAVNSESFYFAFKEILNQKKDILYVGFSSGLSTTYNSARIAAIKLSGEYPTQKIITVDSLCASAGQGLLIRLLLDKKELGESIEAVAKYAESVKKSICHWFTVSDLVYLKRGGRISPTLAFVGNALGIKPILHVDNDGHLVNFSKVRGRKASIFALAEKYGELAKEKKKGKIYISHAFCEDDARALSDILKEKYGQEASIITDVGTVIGAHSGPGTLALFFVGKER